MEDSGLYHQLTRHSFVIRAGFLKKMEEQIECLWGNYIKYYMWPSHYKL